jgi:hypothetical protein
MQRIRWKLAAFVLLLLPLLWAQGTVSATLTQLGTSGTVYVIQFNWTGDTGGNVPVTAAGNLPAVQGYEITQIECAPGTPQPSATYSVAVLDAGNVDVLAGAANAVSGGQAQTFNAASSTPPLQGTLRLQVTNNTINGAKGVVYVFLQKPGTLSAKKIRGMGSGGGGAFTADWLTLANAPFMDARRYRFAPQAPGGNLIAGSNTITLQPCPIGVNGSDPNHYLYISGGTGTAESVLITGGGCVSGNASSTVTFTAANSHSGAWTVQSASGGIQEAICALPAAGGLVGAPISVTLYANVNACGKTLPRVSKQAGVTLSGSFTILGGPSTGTTVPENFLTVASWATAYDVNRTTLGAFPISYQQPGFAATTYAIDIPAGAVGGTHNAFSGYARTKQPGANAVGIFGYALAAAAYPASAWGANFMVDNCAVDPGTSCVGNGGSQANLWGIEVDMGSRAPGIGIGLGIDLVTAMNAPPTAYSAALRTTIVGGSVPWTYGLMIDAATTSSAALWIRAVSGGTGASNSQPIWISGRASDGSARTAVEYVDSAGNVFLLSGNPGSGFIFEDATGAAAFSAGPTGFTVPFLKATTGVRYVCVDVSGRLISQGAPCTGT